MLGSSSAEKHSRVGVRGVWEAKHPSPTVSCCIENDTFEDRSLLPSSSSSSSTSSSSMYSGVSKIFEAFFLVFTENIGASKVKPSSSPSLMDKLGGATDLDMRSLVRKEMVGELYALTPKHKSVVSLPDFLSIGSDTVRAGTVGDLVEAEDIVVVVEVSVKVLKHGRQLELAAAVVLKSGRAKPTLDTGNETFRVGALRAPILRPIATVRFCRDEDSIVGNVKLKKITPD